VVLLEPATVDDRDRLATLLELYAHELSPVFDLKPGPDGRYGYDKLPLYWSEPTRRFPFLIFNGDEIAGFALATRGSPASDDPDVRDVAEFFVLRAHRGGGVGRRAAHLLWDRLPGRWTVRVSLGNEAGCRFWPATIAAYARETVTQTTMPGRLHPWRVFAFR
jgi:predicted acetyltransferase